MVGSGPLTSNADRRIMNSIDVFVINYFSAADTAQTIRHLGQSLVWKFWVLDNSQSDHEWQELQNHLKPLNSFNIELERAPTNLGFGKACNVLFQRSQAPFCLLLNPDARLDSVSLQTLHSQLESNPRRAALAPMMRWLENENWWIANMPKQTWQQNFYLTFIGIHPKLFRFIWQRYYQVQITLRHTSDFVEQDFLSGAILLIRRSAAIDVASAPNHLFDERYFMFFEDTDLSMRLRKGGYHLGIAPQALGSHCYRHAEHKNSLLNTSQKIFAMQWHPKVLSWAFSWLSSIKCPLWLSMNQTKVIRSLAELVAELGEQKLIAWSPSPYRIPAIWRELEAFTESGFSKTAWDTLASGRYYAIAIDSNQANPRLTLIAFDKP